MGVAAQPDRNPSPARASQRFKLYKQRLLRRGTDPGLDQKRAGIGIRLKLIAPRQAGHEGGGNQIGNPDADKRQKPVQERRQDHEDRILPSEINHPPPQVAVTTVKAEDVPITVAFGDNDRLLPAPRFQQRDLAPAHARWEVLWNCGHAPMWDVPSVTTALVRETAARSADA